MTYRVILSPTARRELRRIPPKILPALMEFMAGALAENPHRIGKPGQDELADYYIARRGTYRIVYQIDDDIVLVTVASLDHRSKIYRQRG